MKSSVYSNAWLNVSAQPFPAPAGTSHHTKPAVMNWLEAHSVDFATGQKTNSRLRSTFAQALANGEDLRFIITSFENSGAKYLYETAYCGRGAMELMIKDHKNGLLSDRTSCHRFSANQFRLFLLSAAYVVLHHPRTVQLRGTKLCRAEFKTIRLKLLKIGVRVEKGKARIRLHFPEAFAEITTLQTAVFTHTG